MHLSDDGTLSLIVGARSSKLSKVQVWEVFFALFPFYPDVLFSPIWIETIGDKDKKQSLRDLGKTDFFTKEIDEMLLEGRCRIAIHSAKDLPEPLAKGLSVVALTKGQDPSDSLVLRENETLDSLKAHAAIGTSCMRREQMVKSLRSDLNCVDIRGTIEERLAKLDQRQVDGVVMAECALIRLNLTSRNRIPLQGETAPLQGQLAICAREDDIEMKELFACLDTRFV